MAIKLILTTNPGIEDVVIDEAKAKLKAKPIDIRYGKGRLVIEVDEDYLDLLDYMRSIHRAKILLAHGKICGEVECLKDLKDVIMSLEELAKYVTPYTSFAIVVERAGDHKYSSMDIARVSGDAVIELAIKHHGRRPKVDLDYPNVMVSVDIIEDEYYVSVELSGDISWHRRGYRVYDHPAALKPTLAYAMIYISGMRDGDTLLDPMCGGGTIPIEAAYVFESSKLLCTDYNPLHIEGAKMNALAAGVYRRISFHVVDARRLSKELPRDNVDFIISNPPYGIRLGSPYEVRRLYQSFIREAAELSPARIVLITTEHRFVKEEAEKHGYRIIHERTVAHGNLWPRILVLG